MLHDAVTQLSVTIRFLFSITARLVKKNAPPNKRLQRTRLTGSATTYRSGWTGLAHTATSPNRRAPNPACRRWGLHAFRRRRVINPSVIARRSGLYDPPPRLTLTVSQPRAKRGYMSKILAWLATPLHKLPWWHSLWFGFTVGCFFGGGLVLMTWLANNACSGR